MRLQLSRVEIKVTGAII